MVRGKDLAEWAEKEASSWPQRKLRLWRAGLDEVPDKLASSLYWVLSLPTINISATRLGGIDRDNPRRR
ncbi:hypothetical protein GCM10007901_00960 [Dyella acidisoli]|uniref:Uncharacterized protein n=1 Tax=Dyella acidisoli TaxID=1867834 RepID=A0ABQ5XKL8_9GAMM|nr:hypothetical protein GCM10007901_00960 [Dyella acidisoli]